MAFSKVDYALLEDEEEERQCMVAKAEKLYKAAESAQHAKGCTREVLALFREAEDALAPLFESSGGGLVSLRNPELEKVLKGRLYQAVIIAQLEDSPAKWPEVKALTEDVLHFDAHNCHALWLRGAALFHGDQTKDEALTEMRSAVEFARAQGKKLEADQWEAELRKLESSESDSAAPAAGPAVSGSTSQTAEEPVLVGTSSSASSSAVAAAAKPAVRKGFLNKEKLVEGTTRAGSEAATSAANVPFFTGSSSVPNGQESDFHANAAAEAKARKQTLEQRSKELDDLRAQLAKQQQRTEGLRQRLPRNRRALRGALQSLESELNQVLGDRDGRTGVCFEAMAAKLDSFTESLSEANQSLKEGKAWADAQQSRYTDFATELATLREMTTRELRERKESSKAHLTEVRKATEGLSELRTLARSVRDRVKTSVWVRETIDKVCHADDSHAFRTLPTATKLAAFADDAAVLRLGLGAAMLGAIAALGMLDEGFNVFRCRFVCAR